MSLMAFEAGTNMFDTGSLDRDVEDLEVRGLRQYIKRADGQLLPIELTTKVIESQDTELLVFTFRDISQQLNYEEQIRHNAFFDHLTMLPNRALFFDRLDSSINRRKRGSDDHFAVVFFDLDGFSAINEGLGHDVGDKVIHEVGARFSQTVRPDDTVSRFSGDIFAVLFDPVDSVNGAIQAVNRIQRAIEAPMNVAGHTVEVSVSAGIVLHHDLYHSPEEMVRDADVALHRAKADARGSYVVFDGAMHQNALRFIEFKSGMQTSLVDGDFEVHYQPIVDIESNKLVSMEALVRWHHPEKGMVSPADFIPIAEETG